MKVIIEISKILLVFVLLFVLQKRNLPINDYFKISKKVFIIISILVIILSMFKFLIKDTNIEETLIVFSFIDYLLIVLFISLTKSYKLKKLFKKNDINKS